MVKATIYSSISIANALCLSVFGSTGILFMRCMYNTMFSVRTSTSSSLRPIVRDFQTACCLALALVKYHILVQAYQYAMVTPSTYHALLHTRLPLARAKRAAPTSPEENKTCIWRISTEIITEHKPTQPTNTSSNAEQHDSPAREPRPPTLLTPICFIISVPLSLCLPILPSPPALPSLKSRQAGAQRGTTTAVFLSSCCFNRVFWAPKGVAVVRTEATFLAINYFGVSVEQLLQFLTAATFSGDESTWNW